MTVVQFFALVYCAVGVGVADHGLKVAAPVVLRETDDRVATWLGGVVAGLLLTMLWAPVLLALYLGRRP